MPLASCQGPPWNSIPVVLEALCPGEAKMPARPWAPPQGLAGEWGWGTGSQPVMVWFSLHDLHGWGRHRARPESVSTCRSTQAAPGITSQQTALAGFTPGQGGAGQSPTRFIFLPMLLLEAVHRLPRGNVKEEETQ